MSEKILQTLTLIAMNKEIEKWLQDTKRTMDAGVQLFERCAPKELRAKYLPYFQANKNAKAHQTPYSMLINKLTFIQRNNLAVQQAEAVKVVEAPVAPAVSVEDRPLTQLDSVPEELQPKVERIKEIVPMIAALTAKIADKNLPLAEAKEISEEIVALETERRELWGDIDAYANAAPAPKVEEEVVLPTTIAEKNKAIKNLKEKIKRNNQAAKNATTEEKRQNSLGLVEKYTKELILVEAAEVAE